MLDQRLGRYMCCIFRVATVDHLLYMCHICRVATVGHLLYVSYLPGGDSRPPIVYVSYLPGGDSWPPTVYVSYLPGGDSRPPIVYVSYLPGGDSWPPIVCVVFAGWRQLATYCMCRICRVATVDHLLYTVCVVAYAGWQQYTTYFTSIWVAITLITLIYLYKQWRKNVFLQFEIVINGYSSFASFEYRCYGSTVIIIFQFFLCGDIRQ